MKYKISIVFKEVITGETHLYSDYTSYHESIFTVFRFIYKISVTFPSLTFELTFM